jgi:hypothetical protein
MDIDILFAGIFAGLIGLWIFCQITALVISRPHIELRKYKDYEDYEEPEPDPPKEAPPVKKYTMSDTFDLDKLPDFKLP